MPQNDLQLPPPPEATHGSRETCAQINPANWIAYQKILAHPHLRSSIGAQPTEEQGTPPNRTHPQHSSARTTPAPRRPYPRSNGPTS